MSACWVFAVIIWMSWENPSLIYLFLYSQRKETNMRFQTLKNKYLWFTSESLKTLNSFKLREMKFVAPAPRLQPAPPPTIKYQPSQINFTHDRHPTPSCPPAPPLQLSALISIYMISVVNITRSVIHKRCWRMRGGRTPINPWACSTEAGWEIPPTPVSWGGGVMSLSVVCLYVWGDAAILEPENCVFTGGGLWLAERAVYQPTN